MTRKNDPRKAKNVKFAIERKQKDGSWKRTQHIVSAVDANHAVAGPKGFVVGRKRGYMGTATAKSGTKYRAVAI